MTTTDITWSLRQAAQRCESVTGVPPEKISSHSLRSGGATALLVARCDPTNVQLMGRWKSDAVLRCLRVQALAFSHTLAQDMLSKGGHTFNAAPALVDGQPVPTEAAPFVAAALGPLADA